MSDTGAEITPAETNTWRIVNSIRAIWRRWNARGQVTLRANQTTTPVTRLVSPGAVNVAVGDEILLSPRSANAAVATANVYVSAVVQGGFTLTHANTATTDRTFGWGAR